MPKKLLIEITKHSERDYRIIVKSDSETIRASVNDSCLSRSLVMRVVDGSPIFFDPLIHILEEK